MLERAPGGEREADHGDRPDPSIAEALDQPVDTRAECTRLVDDRECRADEEHEGDDVRGADDPVRDRDERLEWSERLRRDVMIRPGDDDASSGRRVIGTII